MSTTHCLVSSVNKELQTLMDFTNGWALLDSGDIAARAYEIYATIKAIGDKLKGYVSTAGRQRYPEILEPCDVSFLRDQIRFIVGDREEGLYEKAKALRGKDAIFFIDRLLEVPTIYNICVLRQYLLIRDSHPRILTVTKS